MLQGLIDGGQQLATQVAIAGAVVGGEADREQGAWQHLIVHHPGPLEQAAETDDGDLRRVDDTQQSPRRPRGRPGW